MKLIEDTINDIEDFISSNLNLRDFFELYKGVSLDYTLPCIVKFFLWFVIIKLKHQNKQKYEFDLESYYTLIAMLKQSNLVDDNDSRFGYLR